MVDFLPKGRDLTQILGRAGRFGAPGISRMILNKEDLQEQLGQKKLSLNFYTATQSYVKQQHDIMDRKTQIERLIKFALSDFKDDLTENFFRDFFPQADGLQNTAREHWQEFNDRCDKKWATTWKLIQDNRDDKLNPSLETINEHLSVYQGQVTAEWEALKNTLKNLSQPPSTGGKTTQ